jgi:histidinol dehydrogenase
MQWLQTTDPDFAGQFARLVADTRDPAHDLGAAVADILASVRSGGFAALADFSLRFDRAVLTPETVLITAEERRACAARVDTETRTALTLAASRIRAFHEAQRPADGERAEDGIRAGWRWTPVERAGLYVPGGRAAYPSSVLMNAVPARVAGVGELVVCTPAPEGALNPLVMLALDLVGVDRAFRLGGAHAVAAMAYGTAPVPRCDLIVGPGNAYVAEAKRQLYGAVGIDMVAGPSEILVVADAAAPPSWVAADLLSQAEHDPVAQSILITDSAALAEAVVVEVEAMLRALPTAAVARESWGRYGTVIVVRDLDEAPDLCNALAAEHLELMVADPEALFARIRHAGSVFLGRHTPEAIGDYLGGPNHVLPTGRRARFSGGLSVHNFLKRTTWLDCSEPGFDRLARAAAALADAEGLAAHALSVRVRRGDRPGHQ